MEEKQKNLSLDEMLELLSQKKTVTRSELISVVDSIQKHLEPAVGLLNLQAMKSDNEADRQIAKLFSLTGWCISMFADILQKSEELDDVTLQ